MTAPRPLKIAREIAIWLDPAPPVKGVTVAKFWTNPDQHPHFDIGAVTPDVDTYLAEWCRFPDRLRCLSQSQHYSQQ